MLPVTSAAEAVIAVTIGLKSALSLTERNCAKSPNRTTLISSKRSS